MIDQKTILRYLSFYLCLGIVFSTYSYLLDILFHPYGYNKRLEYSGAWGGYMAAYLIFFYISLPIATAYNTVINFLPKKFMIRIIFATIVGAITGAIFDLGSYYIGTYEKVKNIIVMVLVGITIEIIRILIVQKRENKMNLKSMPGNSF